MPTVSVVELNDEGQEIEERTQSFQVDEGEVVFDALDNQGHKLPHGCLSGSCGSCRIQILEGDENLSTPSYIEGNTIENISKDYIEKNGREFMQDKKIRLSCRARANGDVKICPLKK